MPQFNDHIEWCSGIAGVGVYWQGGTIWPPGHGGGTQWFNSDEVIAQRTDGLGPNEPVGLYAYNVRTGATRLLFDDAVHFVAGSAKGHWVVRTVVNGISVVCDSFGRRLNGAGIGDGALGPDGSYVVKREYHSRGPFDIHRPDGTVAVLLDACHPQNGQILPAHDIYDLVNYGWGSFTWRTASGWHAQGFPVPLPLTSPADWFRYVLIADELWQMYRMPDGRFVAHPWGETTGIVLHVGDTFRPDEFVRGTQVEVVWSVTPGEDPAGIRLSSFGLFDPRVSLETPLPAPNIEPYGRQLPHVAYYTLDADRDYGDHYEEIQHACWCATESDVAKANEQQAWVIAAPWLIRKARKPAMVMIANDYENAPPLSEQFPEATALARELKCGLLAMDEDDWRDIPDGIPEGAFLAFKVFRDPNESIDDWRKRALDATDRVLEVNGYPCWILGCDDRNFTLSDDLIIKTLDAATKIYGESDVVRMSLEFSYARAGKDSEGHPAKPGGGIVHPEAWKWCKASAAASNPVVWSEYALPNEEPEPEPEEPDMADRVYIEDPSQTKTPVKMLPRVLKEIDKGDGNVALQLEDGKLLSVMPDGTFTYDATGAGAYQLFKISKNNPSQYIVQRHGTIYRFGRLVEA